MRIQNEQLLGVQETDARRVKAQPEDGFEALLTKQLTGQAHEVAGDTTTAALPGVGPVLPGALPQAGASGIAAEMATMNRMEGMFAGFEQYAAQISNENKANLREAYGLLENMTKEIKSIREAYPTMQVDKPELAAMVNELDVLATTETFKFNRGDYL